ncbi:MAG: hypothetical protein ACR2MY_08850 [Candidatus Dormibacteria bacterium]
MRRLSRTGLLVGGLATVVLAIGTTVSSAATIGFTAPVKLAGNCGGEPSIDLDGKGHVYVSSPKGIVAGFASCDGLLTRTSGVATWASSNGGTTFGPKITVGTINGGGDSDTAVDPLNGDVYIADLEAVAAEVCVSTDRGQTYHTVFTGAESCSTPTTFTGQTGPENDRQWINVYGPSATYPHKDVYLSYHDFATGLPLVFRSQDGGPFLPLPPPSIAAADPTIAAAVANGTVVAKPVLDKDGGLYELVTTQATGNGPLQSLYLFKSTDHGMSWTASTVFDGTATGANIGLVFNDLAIDGGGNLYALTLGNTAGVAPPDNAYLFTSTDQGKTFSGAKKINADANARGLAALHGGPLAGQLVLGWFHSTNTSDTNTVTGQWKYQALESTNATAAVPTFATADLGSTSNPATGIVHQGQICTQGILCTTGQLTGGGQGNRNLADFSSVVVDQNGCAVFTYGDDGTIKPDQSNYAGTLVNNDVARQTTGCFPTALATAPSPAPVTASVASPLPSVLPNTAVAGGPGTLPGRAVLPLVILAVVGVPVVILACRFGRA